MCREDASPSSVCLVCLFLCFFSFEEEGDFAVGAPKKEVKDGGKKKKVRNETLSLTLISLKPTQVICVDGTVSS